MWGSVLFPPAQSLQIKLLPGALSQLSWKPRCCVFPPTVPSAEHTKPISQASTKMVSRDSSSGSRSMGEPGRVSIRLSALNQCVRNKGLILFIILLLFHSHQALKQDTASIVSAIQNTFHET